MRDPKIFTKENTPDTCPLCGAVAVERSRSVNNDGSPELEFLCGSYISHHPRGDRPGESTLVDECTD